MILGNLVCFARPAHLKRGNNYADTSTPRSLSALGPYMGYGDMLGSNDFGYSELGSPLLGRQSPTADSPVSISKYYTSLERVSCICKPDRNLLFLVLAHNFPFLKLNFFFKKFLI